MEDGEDCRPAVGDPTAHLHVHPATRILQVFLRRWKGFVLSSRFCRLPVPSAIHRPTHEPSTRFTCGIGTQSEAPRLPPLRAFSAGVGGYSVFVVGESSALTSQANGDQSKNLLDGKGRLGNKRKGDGCRPRENPVQADHKEPSS